MRLSLGLILSTVMLFVTSARTQQIPVSRIEIVVIPEKIRCFETAVIQVKAYAEIVDRHGNKQTIRLRRSPDYIRILGKDRGWLSKPFLSQTDRVQLQEDSSSKPLLDVTEDVSMKDSVLYSALEKTGKFEIEASLDGKKEKCEIEVSSAAPTQRQQEKIIFGEEPTNQDPYLQLVAHYSPLVAQETWFQPKSDYLARFDYDGDWQGDNNWDALEKGSSQAFVYYAVMETKTHWFIVYNFFHPRDYSEECPAGFCHENDSEGMIVTVAKEGSGYGHLQAMETLAHNNIYSFQADDEIKKGVHDIDGKIELEGESHPVVFIESGGHGVYGSCSQYSRFNLRTKFTAGTGITYVYKGKAERPKHANDRRVGYELLPITEHWWKKVDPASGWKQRTFEDLFQYKPVGGRPPARFPAIPKAFVGRKHATNKAKPFWGWHDNRTEEKKILVPGQWGLDPAYAVSKNLRFPSSQAFSLEYIYNPFLDLDISTKTE